MLLLWEAQFISKLVVKITAKIVSFRIMFTFVCPFYLLRLQACFLPGAIRRSLLIF
jgi:hypothetical protein